MQCVDLRSVQSNKIIELYERLCTHTRRETRIGYAVWQLPTFVELSLDVRCFTIYQSGYSWTQVR